MEAAKATQCNWVRLFFQANGSQADGEHGAIGLCKTKTKTKLQNSYSRKHWKFVARTRESVTIFLCPMKVRVVEKV